jgi:hypothetical protein
MSRAAESLYPAKVDRPGEERLLSEREARLADAAALRDAGLVFLAIFDFAAGLGPFAVFDAWSVAFMDNLLF